MISSVRGEEKRRLPSGSSPVRATSVGWPWFRAQPLDKLAEYKSGLQSRTATDWDITAVTRSQAVRGVDYEEQQQLHTTRRPVSMADELVLNFDAPADSAPAARANRAKGGRWTDRAKERKRSQIELRRAGKAAGGAGGGAGGSPAGANGEAKRSQRPREGQDASQKPRGRPSAAGESGHGGGGGGGGGGRGRLEQAVGPAGKKQYISSLFTAEGLPVPSTSNGAAGSAPVIPARPSNAPMTSAPQSAEGGHPDGEADPTEEEEGEEAQQGPDPAPELSKLGLSREIVTALAGKLGISGPTACQAGAIPRLLHTPALAGKHARDPKGKGKKRAPGVEAEDFAHDAILRAQTGSGKTLTFLLPMLEDLLRLPPSVLTSATQSAVVNRTIGTLALILAPTRELATQIHTVLSSLLSALPFSSRFTVSPRTLTAGLLVGGANRTHEKRRLRKGCPIVVATPGRLLDHLKTTEAFRLAGEPVRSAGPSGRPGGAAGKGANAAPLGQRGSQRGAAGSTSQLGLRWLIVDECDRLMDLGFEEQMRGILEEVERRTASAGAGGSASSGPTKPKRRTILCSATASEGVDRLAGLAVGGATADGDEGAEGVAASLAVIGARDDVRVPEPARRDLTVPVTTKRSLEEGDDEAEVEERASADEGAGGAEAISTALAVRSGFTPPSQLLHNYVIVPPKLRFVALVALLRKLLVRQQAAARSASGQGPGKVLVFMSCTDAVDFWWKALGKIKMGSRADDGADEDEEDEADADADRLVSLHPLLSGVPIYRLHGSLPLKTRLASLNAFSGSYTIEEGKKAGQETDAGVLLCTSVAARGLDVKNVGCVVQVDAPTEVSSMETLLLGSLPSSGC